MLKFIIEKLNIDSPKKGWMMYTYQKIILLTQATPGSDH